MFDAGSFAALITKLNIARGNTRAYPKEHPVIAESLAKALCVYDDLLHAHEEIMLGVTGEGLMVAGAVLEKSNVVLRDFSRVLFEHGIGVLQLHRGITIEELKNFTIILGLKREQIHQDGGIEQVWAKANIAAIKIRPIRYDLFTTTEGDSATASLDNTTEEGLWERFARELTLGELYQRNGDDACLDPEVLAEILNQQFVSGCISETKLASAISNFLAPVNGGLSSEAQFCLPYQKQATFISSLTPELRRQFLGSSFGDKSRDRCTAAEHIVSNLPNSAVYEIIEDINHNRLSVSPVVLKLLQRVGQNSSSPHNDSKVISDDNDLSRKMKTIFREHVPDEFVPDDYQKKLNQIIASDRITSINLEEISDLLFTFENESIESSIGLILMDLIREGVDTPEERDMLMRNFGDMFGYILQTGDYGQLLTIIDQLNGGTFPVEIQYRLRDEYGRREFLEEILDGLTIWGKPRYGDIRSLIHKIGGQFVEVILDRLSEEQNMSLRRFFMDILIELGPVTRIPIANRLYDNRWYFLRNLLIILSAQDNPDVVPLIQPQLHSEDPRVHHEVLKTLVHFHDQQAEKMILEDLESHDQEILMEAIQLAEQCKSPAITNCLVGMLSMGGFSQLEYEKKSAIVHALGEIGRVEILPELAKILSSQSLLHSRQLTKLKSDIILSFSKYPANISRPILDHIANGSGKIARLASDTLKTISVNQK